MTTEQPRIRVMVVEDNPSDVHLVRMALEQMKLDFDLIPFDDGEAALGYIETEASAVPDAILLDVNLPKVEGASILAVVRATPRFARVPVVALSSSSSPREVEKLKALGADCFIVKPTDLDDFLQIGYAIQDCIRAANSANRALPGQGAA